MYDASKIEQKWQKKWRDLRMHETDLTDDKRKKYYSLVMFPYPSGDRLHIGHWYQYGPCDSFARFIRMKGFNVFEPMGFDAFGLPAENYAIKTGVHPVKSISTNTKYMTEQLSRIGTMYDWSKTLNTSKPDYYKWTEWLFLLMYKRGLAERRKAPVNWCPSCQTVLANEQVQDGKCERCDAEVTKKDLVQWFWKMSSFAQRLLDGHKKLNWPKKTMLMQENWIGRSEGINIIYQLAEIKDTITVFTTRPDTNFGATFIVVAPDSEFVKKHRDHFDPARKKDIEAYIKQANNKTELERIAEGQKKTGAFTGLHAINQLTGKKMPIFISDFVLAHVGTGHVVGVPGHDIRDFEFAKEKGLEIIRVVVGSDGDTSPITKPEQVQEAMGTMINSDFLNGINIHEATKKIMDHIEKNSWGKRIIRYRLKDWLISRQRYWGAPIPIIICPKCGDQPVPEKDLPVLLPENVEFKPRGDGKSPLATSSEFVKTKCPKCGADAERETDTMDTFVDSSFYYLRYLDPKNEKEFADKNLAKKWMPIDMYIGGPEHACMHLIYARFVNMVLFDAGISPTEEPFQRLVHQGLITYKGAKMSKTKGNVVSPDGFVEQYGSDVFRLYLMFMGPFEAGGDWNDKGIKGTVRFVERFYNLINLRRTMNDERQIEKLIHKTIKRVTEDIENLQFNTAIAALMMFLNETEKIGLTDEQKKILVRLIAPVAPHLAEECWENFGEKKSVFNESYPTYDPKLITEEEVTIVIQINGRVRAHLKVPAGTPKEKILAQAIIDENIKKHLDNKKIQKEIFIPDKLLNLVA